MPTRKDQTTITIDKGIKKVLDSYRADTETWDQIMEEMIQIIIRYRQQAGLDI